MKNERDSIPERAGNDGKKVGVYAGLPGVQGSAFKPQPMPFTIRNTTR
jgi:hypothetical protein